jgi:P pilus assembly chaperone PapD
MWAFRLVLGRFLFLMLLLGAAAAHGYEVAPMRLTIVPEEGRSGSIITINNVRDEALRVEILVKRRVIAEDGTQSFEPAEDDFVIFPPQISIPPRSSQAVRFEYVGPPLAGLAKGYVIEVSEVPVVNPGFSGVQFAYNFGVAVYVEPPRATSRLTTTGRIDNNRLLLDVVNEGSGYALLSEMSLVLEAEGERFTLTSNEVAELVNNPLVAPGGRRTLDVELPKPLPSGPVRAEFRRN